MTRSTLRTLAIAGVLAVAAIGTLLASGGGAVGSGGPPDTYAVKQAERAAGPRYAAGVGAGDRAWIEAAIAGARPEAQALIREVDGLIEFQTHTGLPLGVTRGEVGHDHATMVIDLDVAALNGRRVVDREVTVLHELGHVIDFVVVDQELNDTFDAGIPRTGACGSNEHGLSGSCTEPAERFADTFAKWALNGRVSAVGAGYGIADPPSLEGWGAPLAVLAGELARGD
jgi:hypothetical protein